MSCGKLTKKMSMEEFSFETRNVVLNYFSLLPPTDLSASKTSGSSGSDPLSASGRLSGQATTPGEGRPDSAGIQAPQAGEETCHVVPLVHTKKPSFDQLPVDKDAPSQFLSDDLPLMPLRSPRSRSRSPQRPLTLDLVNTSARHSSSSGIPFKSYPVEEDQPDIGDILPRLTALRPGRESPAPDDYSTRSTRGSFTGSELLTGSYVDLVSMDEEEPTAEVVTEEPADLSSHVTCQHDTRPAQLAHIAGSSVTPAEPKLLNHAPSARETQGSSFTLGGDLLTLGPCGEAAGNESSLLDRPEHYEAPRSAGFTPSAESIDEWSREVDTIDSVDLCKPSEASDGQERMSNTSTATTVSVLELDLPPEMKSAPRASSAGPDAGAKHKRLDSTHSIGDGSETPSDVSSGWRWSLRSSGSSGRVSVMAMSSEELATLVRSSSLPPQVLALREELLYTQAELNRQHDTPQHQAGEGDAPSASVSRGVSRPVSMDPEMLARSGRAPAASATAIRVSPLPRTLTPESEVARQLCILGDHIEAEYGEIFNQALNDIVLQAPGFSTEALRDVATREGLLPDSTTPSWRSVAMWMQFTSHVARGILHLGGHKIRTLIDYTSQVIEDRMANFIIEQGGWEAIRDLEIESPDSPSVVTPHFLISPSNPLDGSLNTISEMRGESRPESAASSTQESLTVGEENANLDSLTDIATPGSGAASLPGSTASTDMWESADTVKMAAMDVNSNVNSGNTKMENGHTERITRDEADNLNASNTPEEGATCSNGSDDGVRNRIDVEKVRNEIQMMRQISEQLTGEGGPQPTAFWKKAVFIGSFVLLGSAIIYMLKRPSNS